MADTGVKAPTAAESVGEAPWNDANCGWVNPQNIYGAGEAKVVHASFDSPDQTYVLKAYTFDFSAIPDGATITGVQVVINARYAVSAVSLDLCQLLDTSRAKVGTNMYSTPQALTTSAANYTIGDSTNLWGNALTPAWVKDANFGVAIGAVAGGANSDVFIDSVTMQVWYTVPVSYTLPSAAGSFSEAGTAVALKATRRMVAGTASYSEVGTAVGLRRAFTLVAGTAAFSLAGTAAALAATRRMVAGTAAYSEAGTAVGLKSDRKMSAGTVAFSEVGTAVTLTYVPVAGSYSLSADAGSFSLAGTAAALAATRRMVAGAASHSMVGAAVALKRNSKIIAGATAYSLAGTAAALKATRKIAAEAGAFALAGTDAALVRASKLIAAAGGFSLIGTDVSLTLGGGAVDFDLTASPGSFVFSGSDVRLTHVIPYVSDVWVALELPQEKRFITGSPSHPYRRRIGESMWWVR